MFDNGIIDQSLLMTVSQVSLVVMWSVWFTQSHRNRVYTV